MPDDNSVQLQVTVTAEAEVTKAADVQPDADKPTTAEEDR